MSDFPKLVVFGSFTKEETRKFQKNSVESQKSSQTTRMQFGSLDFNTVLSSGNLNSESRGADFSRRSDSSSASCSVSKVDASKIMNVAEPAKAKEVVASQVNGSAGKCIPNLQLIEKDADFFQKSDSSSTSSSVSKDDTSKRNAAKPAKAKDVFASQANGSASKYIPNLKSIENGKLGISLSSICISDETKTSDAINRDADIDSSRDATGSSSESDFYLNSPNAVVSSSGDFPKRSAHNSLNGENVGVKPLLPRGLINSGNLCFLNAALQALLSCAPFVHLLQYLRASDIPKTVYPTVLAFVEFIAHFDMPNDLISKMNEQSVIETGSSFLPAMFESVLRSFTPDLSSNMSNRSRQEDAQEFLSFVMDRLHDELLKMDGYRSDSSGGLSSLVSSQEDDGWETVGPKNKSAVTRTQSLVPSELSNIFGGELRSVVKARGNTDSATVQPFFLLHLDIFPDAVHNIQDALNLFVLPETLEGYKTSGRKAGVVSASKDVKIQKLSKILILHLMRFSYGNRGTTKLHKPVHFPLEFVLRRNLLASPTSESRKYELVATITHHGRDPSKGHYTADARYSNGIWLRYDDASVTAVPASKVLHDQAYVLFYRQV